MLHGDGGFGRDALGQEHAGGVEEGLAAGGQELAAIGQWALNLPRRWLVSATTMRRGRVMPRTNGGGERGASAV